MKHWQAVIPRVSLLWAPILPAVQLWGATAMACGEIAAAWANVLPAVPGWLALPPLGERLGAGRLQYSAAKSAMVLL